MNIEEEAAAAANTHSATNSRWPGDLDRSLARAIVCDLSKPAAPLSWEALNAVGKADGLKGFDVGGWYAVYGPKGMSPDLQARLNKAINAALAQPELKAKYKELGYEEWVGSPQTLSERAAKERQMWSTVTQGIVVD